MFKLLFFSYVRAFVLCYDIVTLKFVFFDPVQILKPGNSKETSISFIISIAMLDLAATVIFNMHTTNLFALPYIIHSLNCIKNRI